MYADFEREILAGRRREGILPPGVSVLVAASGGPDSTALLYALHALAAEQRWRLAAGHLDHALRPDSAEDAAFVRRQAAALGLPFHAARVDVRGLPTSVGRSPEEAARIARRSFLRRAARRFGADYVALGHTLDDQAETVLINLARGAGALGLAGMAPAAGIFVRPLLDRSRAEVLAYLADRRLDWREDPTNLDPAFTRNWFRHNVIPMLEGRMPGARTSLAALAAAGRADERALEGRVAALTSALVLEETPGRLSLAGTFPAALSPAHRGRAVRHIYRRLVGSTRALERRHVEAVLALGPGGAAALPANVLARREADGWTFERRTPAPQLRAWEVTLNVPGKTALLPAAAEVAAELAAAPAELRGLGLDEVWLAARFAGGGLVARSWRDGDCMRPVGLGGRKKLQDIFVDGHVPAAARRRWPVVCEGEDIIWVPGLALAEGASAAPGGDSLRLRCVRTAGPARERNPYGLQRERR